MIGALPFAIVLAVSVAAFERPRLFGSILLWAVVGAMLALVLAALASMRGKG
jgi:hypothetical protein